MINGCRILLSLLVTSLQRMAEINIFDELFQMFAIALSIFVRFLYHYAFSEAVNINCVLLKGTNT